MNPSENPDDRLLDSLLREQHRNAADEPLLRDIEAALNTATSATPAIKRRHRLLPSLAAAATIALSVGAVVYWQEREKSRTPSGMAMESKDAERSAEAAPAVRDRRINGLPKKPPLSRYESLWGNSPLASKPVPPSTLAQPAETDAAIASAEAKPQDGTLQRGAFPPSPAIAERQADKLRVESAHEFKIPNGTDSFGSMLPLPLASKEGLGGTSGGLGGGSPGVGYGSGYGTGSGPVGGNGFGKSSDGVSIDATPPARSRASVGAYRPSPDHRPDRLLDRVPGGAGGVSRDQYGPLVDQPWKCPWNDALSTFSIDVDGASYTNVRNLLLHGRPVPPDAVRIEECINYFDYHYEGPKGEGPFAVHGTLATCPWQPAHLLARVAIKGREISNKARPASNLVFLIDVSGSMADPKKLPLLKRSLRVLLDQLDERDRLGIVVYAGSEGVVLPPTTLDERGLSQAIGALEKLEAGGTTNGGAGLKRAYAMASQHVVEGGVNRVILATDGDFNVGTTGQGELVSMVKAEAAKGVSLTVLGFGSGNLNDAMLEAVTKDGNGNYYYIDGDDEARRVFTQKLTGTLVTIAKDVKIQVEFNPGKVKAYRLIGYADRILRHQDFSNDKVDAGDIGAGHTVTAFYEIVPQGAQGPETGEVDGLRYQRPAGREAVPSDDWFTLKLRHKHPEGDVSALIETVIKGEPQAWEQAGSDFRFASAVALFGMKLRHMPEAEQMPWSTLEEIAKPALTDDPHEQRAGFIEMVRKLAR